VGTDSISTQNNASREIAILFHIFIRNTPL